MKKLLLLLLLLTPFFTQSQILHRTIKYGKRTISVTSSLSTDTSKTGNFTFVLGSELTTSAGVFTPDGDTLLTTLWSAERFPAGSYSSQWDGKDDKGNNIVYQHSTYKVKILVNNVQYNWQATAGNTSDATTGPTRHHGYYHAMRGLVFTSTYGYFVTGYSEGTPSIGKFNRSTPHQRIEVSTSGNADENYIATDGTTLYLAGFDANNFENTFVHGINPSTDADITFSSGFNFAPAFSSKTYSTIGYSNSVGCTITGLAVQQSGTNLFISRKALNRIDIVNKNTGVSVGNFTITSPGNICVDGSDNLWVCEGTTVKIYNGTTGSFIMSVTGLSDAKAVQVSPDGTKLVVADGGSSQQLKIYNNSTGVLLNTIGTANGYMSDANVTTSKFYISDVNNSISGAAGKLPFVTFEPDGSYWVNDAGNQRVLHYNSSNVYINNIMCIGAVYSVYVDKNDITKVLSGPLEFSMDYAVQNLTGFSGWNLVRNYAATVSSATYDLFQFSKNFTTLSNGKSYGFIRKGYTYEVAEFPLTGTIRFTGVILSNLSSVLCSDGSYQTHTESGEISTITRYPLTGFDGSSNPIWSSTGEVLIRITRDTLIGNPSYPPTNQIFTTNYNKVILFNTGIESKGANSYGPAIIHTGYHLGVYRRGVLDTFFVQTELSTKRTYSGEYPSPGWFDNGNGVNGYAGGQANILDRNIITSYHGEFWKNGQTNMFNHYYDNGLAIGQFGITSDKISGRSFPKMAGNALTPILVKDLSGDLYLYHGDESHHSGFHRWKITGLNTISEIVLSINNPIYYTPPVLPYIDLMAGLPFNSTLTNNTAGWTRSPTGEINTSGSDFWNVKTSTKSYNYKKTNDIYVSSNIPTLTDYNVSRDLGNTVIPTSWEISGRISYPKTGVNYNHGSDQQFLQVLDISGKVIGNTYITGAYLGNTNLYFNDTLIASGLPAIIETNLDFLKQYKIVCTSSGITFTYGDYPVKSVPIMDNTAEWNKPKTLRILMKNANGGGFYGKDVVLQNFIFKYQ